MTRSNRTDPAAGQGPLAALAASIAHALREPLTAIGLEAGAVQRVLRGGDADLPCQPEVAQQLREGLRRIQEQATRAEAQIRCLQALMLAEHGLSGGVSGDSLAAFDLGQAIDDVVPLARAAVYNAGLDLHVEVEPSVSRVNGEHARVQHAVLGLLAETLDGLGAVPPRAARLELAARSDAQGSVTMALMLDGQTLRIAALPVRPVSPASCVGAGAHA
ncbi:histidine kinase dimerization/phospho-acceptor domain-containing protein [Cupriavidus plantarum]|uniref:Phospho-acceptor domain-containing protein n=1 Tax=Cupriavidus plantarum TaxID=942865 RepID=A0A316ETF0_9BURK|nr:histidine kinase dimerization/phospho-acceptor domain-containing protein [Cupriavidus plantarum]PWK35634.1 phospho-acceptor domain-containing protein [Cupriavidus plantarum]